MTTGQINEWAVLDWGMRIPAYQNQESEEARLALIANDILSYMKTQPNPLDASVQCVINKAITYMTSHETAFDQVFPIFRKIFNRPFFWQLKFDDGTIVQVTMYQMSMLCKYSSFFQVQMRLGAEGKVSLVPEKFFLQEIYSEQFQWLLNIIDYKELSIDFKGLCQECISWSDAVCKFDEGVELPTLLQYRLLLSRLLFEEKIFFDLVLEKILFNLEDWRDISHETKFRIVLHLYDFFINLKLEKPAHCSSVMQILGKQFGYYLLRCYEKSLDDYQMYLKVLIERNVPIISFQTDFTVLPPYLETLPDSIQLFINDDPVIEAFKKNLLKFTVKESPYWTNPKDTILLTHRIQEYYRIKSKFCNISLGFLAQIYKNYLSFDDSEQNKAAAFLEELDILALNAVGIDFHRFPHLKYLVTNVCVNEIGSLLDLTTLVIAANKEDNIDDHHLRHLENCKALRSLVIEDGEKLIGEGFQYLPQTLEELTVQNCINLTEAALTYLPIGLVKLVLTGSNSFETDLNVTGKHFARLPNLKRIELRGFSGITTDLLEYFPEGAWETELGEPSSEEQYEFFGSLL